MARRRGGLAELARDQALGINQPGAGQPRFIEGPGIYDNGILEHVRVRGYYPPTRKFYDATDRVESLTWTHAVEQAATQCTLTFNDTDGEASAVLNRLGMIWFIETKSPTSQYQERLRVIAWTATITDNNTVEIVAYDALLYLQIAKGLSFLYRVDKDHPKGWRASEIALDIITKYKIPVAYTGKVTRTKGKTYRQNGKLVHTKGEKAQTTGQMKIVRTKFEIPYLHERSVSLYEILAGAYTIDRKHTGNHYYMVSHKGRLAIIRRPSAKRILAITAAQIRTFSFSRDLTASFASVMIPLGADRTGKGTRKARSSQTPARNSSRSPKPGVKYYERATEKPKGLKEVQASEQAALTFLFGNMPVALKLRNIRDRHAFYEEAQKTIDALSRSVKTITLTCEGNVMVKEGDRLQVRIPVSEKDTLKRDLFVKTVTHSMTPGDYSMELELAWREKDVDLSVEVPTEDLHQSKSGSSQGANSGKGGTVTGTGTGGIYKRPELEELWKNAGGPASAAHVAGAIALAESGGNPKAHNPSGASGLWQILGAVSPGNLFEPRVNAENAVKKYKAAGGFSPWVTWTTGAYKAFM